MLAVVLIVHDREGVPGDRRHVIITLISTFQITYEVVDKMVKTFGDRNTFAPVIVCVLLCAQCVPLRQPS